MILRWVFLAAFCASVALQAQSLKVLALYSKNVETDHVEFAEQALRFFSDLASESSVQFDTSESWDKLSSDELRQYKLILWLNDSPHNAKQRQGFEHYMEQGGGWIGFHVAAYNDNDTHWPWFVQFLGGAVFYGNNWPPLPAALSVDPNEDEVTAGLPKTLTAPANEWYIWKPSPRLNKDVKVLLTLAPTNYPLGFKDVLVAGDIPVVWTNTAYNMIYINMGHGDKIFTSSVQNQLLKNAFLSILKGRGQQH